MFVLALALAVPSMDEAVPSDATWTQWRGPARDGRVEGTLPETLNLETQWRAPDLGASYSTPLVTEDTVFSVGTVDKAKEVVQAFDRTTGELRWSTEWKGAMTVPFFAARNGSWVRATPLYHEGRLFIGGIRDVLVCLDASTGDEVWRVDFPEDHGWKMSQFGMVCSPLIHDDSLYVQAGDSVVKLDPETGDLEWSVLEAGANNSAFSSPIVATLGGETQLLVQTRQAMAGLCLEEGTTLWRQPIKSMRGMNILTPLVMGDAVFTSAYGGRSLLLNVTADGDGYDVSQAWSNGVQGYMTSPVLHEGHAYFFTRANRFSCVDLATGDVTYTSGPTNDEYWSLVGCGDKLLALTNNGVLKLIHASPTECTVLDEKELSTQETWAHLVVAGPDVFVREQEALLALRWATANGE